MYQYEEPSLFSGKRGLALLIVIALHVFVGYGFYSGLARRIVQTVIPPVEIAQIDKPKPDDKPPPPPPKPVEAPPPRPGTPPRMDPKHPFNIGEEYYPDASKRANEEGRCVVLMTVAADGRVASESIQTSSGFPRLDDACLKGVHGKRMIPATEDGKPVQKTVSIPIVWKLTNK
jgi:protein TonB